MGPWLLFGILLADLWSRFGLLFRPLNASSLNGNPFSFNSMIWCRFWCHFEQFCLFFAISYRIVEGRLVPSVYTFSSPCSPSYPSSPSFLASCLLATSGVRAQRSGARPLLAGCLDGWLDGLLDGCPLPLPLIIFPCSPSYPSSPSFPASCLLACLLACWPLRACKRSEAERGRCWLDVCMDVWREGWLDGLLWMFSWNDLKTLPPERLENVAPRTVRKRCPWNGMKTYPLIVLSVFCLLSFL